MYRLICSMVALLCLSVAPSLAQEKPADEKPRTSNPEAKPPAEQPKTGPGGCECATEKIEVITAGEKSLKYHLYLPCDCVKEAPLICFIHGYNAIDPNKTYIEWIEHIVKRGNIVIYPIFQETPLEPTDNYAPNCAKSINLALEYLKAEKTKVQHNGKFAIVGHSAGGTTTGNLAAQWEELKIPKPLAAMPVQPGRAFGYELANQRDQGLIKLADFSKIPRECLLLSVYGDSDLTVGSYCANKIFAGATNVPAENKNLVEFRSDVYGSKPMVATHQTPGAPRGMGIDVFDWYGYWKLFDALCDAAFSGKNREYALGGKAEQKFMGKFSDGRAFAELKVTLGNVEIDPDNMEFTPAFDARGKAIAPPKKPEESKPDKKPLPKEEQPKGRRKEEKNEEEKEEEF